MDNYAYFRDHIMTNLFSTDADKIKAAFAGCDQSSCDVRTYGNSATPNWARFWSTVAKSPDNSGFWWMFEYITIDGNLGWYLFGG